MSRQLTDVRLILPESSWQAGTPVKVQVEGETLSLHVSPSAVAAVREAHGLAKVMGHRVNIEVDDAKKLIIGAQAVEQ